MTSITDKLALIWPEIALCAGAGVCLVTGLAGSKAVRKQTPAVAMFAILAAVVMLRFVGPEKGVDHNHFMGLGMLAPYLKLVILTLGLLLIMVATGATDTLKQILLAESGGAKLSGGYEPGDDYRGEFFAFMLFSLAGAMLCAGASDLVWLFLALELVSLPTYVLVATSRDKPEAQESAVKYFFLGALSAAVFLYGFALIYGATGSTEFAVIREYVQANGVSPLMMIGLMLAIVGVCFKIAAVPMHLYTADVYQGASTPVTAFLAVVPKTAGFAALISLLGLAGWGYAAAGENVAPLPMPLIYLLAVIAALTMTVGNALGLLQTNVKRALAYSSIAQSGYMLVGLLAWSAVSQANYDTAGPMSNGLAAVLFYLVAYGLGTISSFAVLASIVKPDGSQAETYDDIAGMRLRHPALAWVLLVSLISMIGLPPMVGLLGKFYLIGAAFTAGGADSQLSWLFRGLILLMLINSAMGAGYYIRIASVVFFGLDKGQTRVLHVPARQFGAAIAAFAAFALGGFPGGDLLVNNTTQAAKPTQIDASLTDDPEAAGMASTRQDQ